MKTNEEDINSPENIKQRIEKNLLLGVMKELNELKGQPRLQLFVTHGFLELIVSILVRSKAKNGKKIQSDTRSYPYSSQILLLNEISVISDQEYKVLDWFRKMRNRAAHEALFKLTNNDLAKVSYKITKEDNLKTPQVEDFT